MWVGKHTADILALRATLAELDTRVDKLQSREAARDRDVRELTVEWKSTYEKFNTLWARLKRRVPKEPPEAPEATNGPQPTINPLALRLINSGGHQ